jgi:hypothetical protein
MLKVAENDAFSGARKTKVKSKVSKVEVKVSAESGVPVVNVTTLPFIYGTKNRARKVH